MSALAAGIVFGLGLCVSGMVNPARIVGFLDVTGIWDSTLIFVMLAAVVLTGIGFPLVTKLEKPLFAPEFQLPKKTALDVPLILGAVLFGIGWGIGGLCPGPAITAVASLSPPVFLFVLAMAVGHLLGVGIEKRFF
jgi:uncharacterized membrane protein YedE/YeeE